MIMKTPDKSRKRHLRLISKTTTHKLIIFITGEEREIQCISCLLEDIFILISKLVPSYPSTPRGA